MKHCARILGDLNKLDAALQDATDAEQAASERATPEPAGQVSSLRCDALVRAVGVTYDGHPCYEVTLNGAVIGHVEGNNPTFERSSKGRRYVNSRWRSKRRYWRVIGADGRTILHDVGTRKRAVEWLVSFCPNVPVSHGPEARRRDVAL